MTVRHRTAAPRVTGFTLIEVLLAVLLLAAGLAIAFAVLRAATATAQRGEAISAASERMRSVEGFLRRRIGSALMIGFATDDQTGDQVRFVGGPDAMRFAADLPDYLGRGGPSLHDVHVATDGGHPQLVVSFASVVAGTVIQDRGARAPEPLVADLTDVHFRYRGIGENNELGDWEDEWKTQNQLPVQVEVRIRSKEAGDWPTLVVALPQAGLPVPGPGIVR